MCSVIAKRLIKIKNVYHLKRKCHLIWDVQYNMHVDFFVYLYINTTHRSLFLYRMFWEYATVNIHLFTFVLYPSCTIHWFSFYVSDSIFCVISVLVNLVWSARKYISCDCISPKLHKVASLAHFTSSWVDAFVLHRLMLPCVLHHQWRHHFRRGTS